MMPFGWGAQEKEQYKTATENAKKQYQADLAAERNAETKRQGAGQYMQKFLAGLAGGKYALPPEAIANLMKARESTAFEKKQADMSKGAGWRGLGGLLKTGIGFGLDYMGGAALKGAGKAAGTAGKIASGLDTANSFMSGLQGLKTTLDAGSPTSLRAPFDPGIGGASSQGYNPFSSGMTEPFSTPTNCPPGRIC